MITYIKEGIAPIINLLGVPFDSTSTYRPGSRMGPNAIREALLNIEVYSSRLDVDLEDISIVDLGNLSQTSDVMKMSDAVEKVVSEIISNGQVPSILGGEHTLSYATFKAAPKNSALLVFDAHADLRNEFADVKFSHTTWLKRFIEERGTSNVIHVGLRASTRDEMKFMNKEGITTISTQTILNTKNPEKILIESLKQFEQVYVSLDMDILDPAYAPGVGNPEAAGISTSQLLEFLYVLKGKKIGGFDIVEVAPQYDAGISSITAAKIMVELICLTHLGRINTS
ncbi:agmatinase [Thermoproteota archaeon]